MESEATYGIPRESEVYINYHPVTAVYFLSSFGFVRKIFDFALVNANFEITWAWLLPFWIPLDP